jgi:hypothetical protein
MVRPDWASFRGTLLAQMVRSIGRAGQGTTPRSFRLPGHATTATIRDDIHEASKLYHSDTKTQRPKEQGYY